MYATKTSTIVADRTIASACRQTLNGYYMTARRLLMGVTGLAGASFAAVNLTEEGEGVQRFFSSVYCVSRIVFDYKLHRLWNSNVPKTELHLRSANRFLRLCQQNGGVMIKAGQYVGTMNHVLPKGKPALVYLFACATLSNCLQPERTFPIINNRIHRNAEPATRLCTIPAFLHNSTVVAGAVCNRRPSFDI